MWMNVRCRKREIPLGIDYGRGEFAPYALLFEATDPRIYENVQRTASTTATTATGGLSFPLTFPLDFGGTGGSGLIAIANTGNFATPWTGPCINPTIENVTTGQIIQTNDYSFEASSTVTYSSESRTVLQDGTSSVKSFLTPDSSWWDIPAGGFIVLKFTSVSGGALTVRWYSARV